MNRIPEPSEPVAKRSTMIPLYGPRADNVESRKKFLQAFVTVYREHVDGFKKAKKEKGRRDKKMEWRIRLEEAKRKRGEASASHAASSSRDSASANYKVSRNYTTSHSNYDGVSSFAGAKKYNIKISSTASLHGKIGVNDTKIGQSSGKRRISKAERKRMKRQKTK